MIVFKKASDLSIYINSLKKNNTLIGFVPTMGALHQGHISLIKKSQQQNQITVCSLFVNPTQFNHWADYEKYPTSIESDKALLEKMGCDVLFLPSVSDIYPNGINNLPHYSLGYLDSILEAKYRPNHFQGVCQVMEILLKLVQPNNLYLGQKDYQQCWVIKKLIVLLQMNTAVIMGNTIREADGLALSSRNVRLAESEKKHAVLIYETLLFIKNKIKPGYIADLKQRAFNYLEAEGFAVDYVEIATANDLQLLDNWDGQQKLVALIAASLGGTRLIDNMFLDNKE